MEKKEELSWGGTGSGLGFVAIIMGERLITSIVDGDIPKIYLLRRKNIPHGLLPSG